jgi:hypothetical protein
MKTRGHEAAIFFVERQFTQPCFVEWASLAQKEPRMSMGRAILIPRLYFTCQNHLLVLRFKVRSSARGGCRAREKKNTGVFAEPLCYDNPKLSDGVKNVKILVSRSEGKALAGNDNSRSIMHTLATYCNFHP